MTAKDEDPKQALLGTTTIDFAIRLGFVGLLGYWSFLIITPLVTIGLWSAILVVALYPLFSRLALRLNDRVAAALVTLLCLMIVIGPMTWLGLGVISGLRSLVSRLDNGLLTIPPPPEFVRDWPIVGERLHQLWSLATSNMSLALAETLPMLRPLGGTLLGTAQSALFGLAQLLVSIVIAGFLFTRGPQLVEVLSTFLDRVLSHRGRELVLLAGATIRNVSRGVIGIAFLQAVLAGAGFVAAGTPVPGVLAFLALLLGIIQIGPTILIVPIVIWSWTVMDAAHAAFFTAYMALVCLIDNILRPLLVGRGLTTPMPVIIIGVIGGTIAYGLVGVFLGPIVLSVAWALVTAWVQGAGDSTAGEKH
ncbi:MAG TPA: AI-2E family transporter [Hyphomicrobiaceae bacterium]|nr:AI-2E family transporter [Hyphomicrobiaceae bacterium]